jgi:hypothetical protein
MREILNSHSVSNLKKEISKTNIKGYSKMKKADIVNLMLKHQQRFSHIKHSGKGGKAEPKAKAKVEEHTKKQLEAQKKYRPKREAKKAETVAQKARREATERNKKGGAKNEEYMNALYGGKHGGASYKKYNAMKDKEKAEAKKKAEPVADKPKTKRLIKKKKLKIRGQDDKVSNFLGDIEQKGSQVARMAMSNQHEKRKKKADPKPVEVIKLPSGPAQKKRKGPATAKSEVASMYKAGSHNAMMEHLRGMTKEHRSLTETLIKEERKRKDKSYYRKRTGHSGTFYESAGGDAHMTRQKNIQEQLERVIGHSGIAHSDVQSYLGEHNRKGKSEMKRYSKAHRDTIDRLFQDPHQW